MYIDILVSLSLSLYIYIYMYIYIYITAELREPHSPAPPLDT